MVAGGWSAGLAAQASQQGNKSVIEGEISQASYGIGYSQVSNLVGQTSGVIDLDAFLRGAADAVAGAPTKVGAEQLETAFQAFTAAIEAKQSSASEGIIAEGQAYRESYAQQDGVVVTESGLAYEVLREGSGPKPALTDRVTTHYHGTLTDGTVFDSSVDRGQPATFPVNGVIRGWQEALQLMNVGSRWRLVIPPELAYGERGAGGSIPPHATLIFEVDLLSIE